jgi:hypothetical protein
MHNKSINQSIKLSGACLADKLMVYISNNNTLKSIYNEYFHSAIKYGIILGIILPTVGRFSLQKINGITSITNLVQIIIWFELTKGHMQKQNNDITNHIIIFPLKKKNRLQTMTDVELRHQMLGYG